jgi:hypothetical protein
MAFGRNSLLIKNRCGHSHCSCGCEELRIHGWYQKYYWGMMLWILRLRCTNCRRTHAVMPTFSMPNSSHSTACVDTYLQNRHEGQSRRQAVVGLSLTAFSYRTLQRLDQRAQLRSRQIKPVEALQELVSLSGFAYLKASGASAKPVATLNQRFLVSNGKGWFFGNITWLYEYRTAVTTRSHNLATSFKTVVTIDSS